jgi:hypothetical protein
MPTSLLDDFLSPSPSAKALLLSKALTAYRSDSYLEEVRLSLAGHAVAKSATNAPAASPLFDHLAHNIIQGRNDYSTNRWSYFFLRILARMNHFVGESEAIVVSPTGMLHTRSLDIKLKNSTKCGKTINEKWLGQFYRGATVAKVNHFGHTSCSHCFSYWSGNGYDEEPERSYEDYASIYTRAVGLAREAIIQNLAGKRGAAYAKYVPINDKVLNKTLSLSKKIDGPYTYWWHLSNEIGALLPEEAAERGGTILESLAKRVEARVTPYLASELSLVFSSFDPMRATNILFSENKELGEVASQAFAGSWNIPLPSPERFASLISSSDDGINGCLPSLIANEWREEIMPLIQKRWPYHRSHTPAYLQKAYRMLPDRKPLHTKGSARLNHKRFQTLIKNQLRAEQMTPANLAAELNLDQVELERVISGEEPSMTYFFSIAEWLDEINLNWGMSNVIEEVKI